MKRHRLSGRFCPYNDTEFYADDGAYGRMSRYAHSMIVAMLTTGASSGRSAMKSLAKK